MKSKKWSAVLGKLISIAPLIIWNIGMYFIFSHWAGRAKETYLLHMMDGIIVASTALMALCLVLLTRRIPKSESITDKLLEKQNNWFRYSVLTGFLTILLCILWFLTPEKSGLVITLMLFLNQLLLIFTPFIASRLFYRK